jgi:hypothetical protein
LMVVKQDILDARPDLASDIFDAFAEAKSLYVRRLEAGGIENPTPVDELHRRVMEITGRDPLPYGIGPNRQALEELLQSALDQKILTRPVTAEELFPRETHGFVAQVA